MWRYLSLQSVILVVIICHILTITRCSFRLAVYSTCLDIYIVIISGQLLCYDLNIT
jgi:hypothetical protein